MDKQIEFKRFGTMIDCSRNSVMNLPSLKKWVDITSGMGYNALLLYTEDTYEVDGQPYFGYMRGRYTKEELKEIDAYAASKGMELIPCIQTLAHLDAIVRWPAYAPHVDTGDILLAGDEVVYDFIDRMFAVAAECFRSRSINIGMDEAHMIGRGKYYDLHGDRNRSQILIEHVNRVAQIGTKHGFRMMMWSDMFFRLASGSDYYNSKAEIDPEVRKQIPDNVDLIYWDYYSQDENRYSDMISAHKKLKETTVFAGGCWSWKGLTPANDLSILNTQAAMAACRKHGVQEAFLTLWGDDGGECSRFALLPSLFYAEEAARGNSKLSDIKAKFQEKFGISYDSFRLLDLPGTPGYDSAKAKNAEKYLLYNDCFTGLMDSTLSGGEGEQYRACARRLARLKNHPQWGWLFAPAHALCDVLSLKAELSKRTREIYRQGDRESLRLLIEDYKKVEKKLERFYQLCRNQWYLENKPHGFDVQDIRLGGLMCRVKNCAQRLQALYDGKISAIEELEETQLDILGNGEDFGKNHMVYWQGWAKIVTVNKVQWF